MSREIVLKAAALRGQAQFRQTIDYVMQNRAKLDDDSRVIALREAFLAAVDGGFGNEATQIAKMIAVDEPNMPSIQKYLK